MQKLINKFTRPFLITCLLFCFLVYLSGSAIAIPKTATWTTKGDFESNASTTGSNTNVGSSLVINGDSGSNSSINFVPLVKPVIATGWGHSLVVKPDGTLWGAGNNHDGQLGLGDGLVEEFPAFTQVEDKNNDYFTDVISVSAGDSHSLLLKSDGTVWSTGDNHYGQLGLGYESNGPTRYFSKTDMADVKAIAAGWGASFVIKSNGTVYAAGRNMSCQLGLGICDEDNREFANFTQAKEQGNSYLTNVIDIDTGYTHTLALKSDGTVWGAGLNNFGQLGQGDTFFSSAFAPVLDVYGNKVRDAIAIEAGAYHSLVLKSNGTVWASGANYDGQLGIGPGAWTYYFIKRFFEQAKDSNDNYLSDVIAISGTGKGSLALKSDGTVWGSGRNAEGEIGLGYDIFDTEVFMQTKDTSGAYSSNVVAINRGMGYQHSLLLKSDGTIWAAGANWASSWALGLGNEIKDDYIKVFTKSSLSLLPVTGTISGLKVNGENKTDWSTISWDGATPVGTAIKFRTRGADTDDGLALASWSDYYITSSSPITTEDSKWLEIEATLESSDGKITPVLNDFTVDYNTNNPPVLKSIGNKTVDEGQLLEFNLSATDLDNDPLIYSTGVLPLGAIFNPATRTFSWTPDYSQAGSYPNVRFEVSDGSDKDSEDIAITVNNVEQASQPKDPGGEKNSGGNGNNPGGQNPSGPTPVTILGTNLILKASPKSIQSGKAVTVNGHLKAANGQPIAGKTVIVKAKVLTKKKVKGKIKIVKKWIWKTIAAVKTDSSGNFALKQKPKETTIYQAEFSGDTQYKKANSNTVKVTINNAKKKKKKR